MSIRHLRIFIMVANCGKMSLAAEKLFITQPSVSQAIKELEEYYKVKLFERLSKKLYITESGKLLLNYANHIIASFDDMEIELKSKGEKLSINIGSSITVGTCMMNNIINSFLNDNKEIETTVIINNTEKIEEMILNSKLDVAIVEGVIASKDLMTIPIYNDKLIVVAGKKHKFYNKGEISIVELIGEDFISREEGSGSRKIFDEILRRNNIKVNNKWISTDTEAIKNAVIDGKGLGILSTMIVDKELENKSLNKIALKEVEMFRQIYLVYHKNKYMSEQMIEFLKLFNVKNESN